MISTPILLPRVSGFSMTMSPLFTLERTQFRPRVSDLSSHPTRRSPLNAAAPVNRAEEPTFSRSTSPRMSASCGRGTISTREATALLPTVSKSCTNSLSRMVTTVESVMEALSRTPRPPSEGWRSNSNCVCSISEAAAPLATATCTVRLASPSLDHRSRADRIPSRAKSSPNRSQRL
jgi:hypothetical protein